MKSENMTTEEYIKYLEGEVRALELKAQCNPNPDEAERYSQRAKTLRSSLEWLKAAYTTGINTADRKILREEYN